MSTDDTYKKNVLQLRIGKKTERAIAEGQAAAEIASKSEFIRQAAIFYSRAVRLHARGGKVEMVEPNGDRYLVLMD